MSSLSASFLRSAKDSPSSLQIVSNVESEDMSCSSDQSLVNTDFPKSRIEPFLIAAIANRAALCGSAGGKNLGCLLILIFNFFPYLSISNNL